MPYIKRNNDNDITAFSLTQEPGFDERLDSDDPELVSFLKKQVTEKDRTRALEASDQSLIRVLEDLIVLLSDKGVIQFTELPEEAQGKLMRRLSMRRAINELSDLAWEDDETINIAPK